MRARMHRVGAREVLSARTFVRMVNGVVAITAVMEGRWGFMGQVR